MCITIEDLKGLPQYDNDNRPCDNSNSNEAATRPKLNKEMRRKYVPERGGKSKNNS
jgi:hypothetical protein